MKKILLSIFALSVLSTIDATAQLVNTSIIPSTIGKHIVPFQEMPAKKISTLKAAANKKKTRGGTEWFSYYDAVNDTNFTSNFYAPMWQDSLVLVRYSNGLFPADMTSFSANFDATAAAFEAPPGNYYSPQSFQVGASNSYTIDSIRVFGAYFRKVNKPTIVDTLVLNYTTSNTIFTGNVATCNLYPHEQVTGVVSDYGVDTLVTFMPALDATSMLMRGPSVLTKKIPLTAAAYPDTTNVDYFTVALGVSVPANKLFLSSWTFKSGDTYSLGDTIPAFNSFRPLTYSFIDGGGDETWPPYYPNDFNEDANADYRAVTYPITSIGKNFYISRFFSNGRNAGVEYHGRNQYIDIEYLVNCATCGPTKVEDISSNIHVGAYPNPTNEMVTFTIKLNNNAKDVSITLSNTIGQEIRAISLGSINANKEIKNTISVADLPAGLYIYTINADGQKMSNKLMVK